MKNFDKQHILHPLNLELRRCNSLEIVKEVRVLGAIGVVELYENIDLAYFTQAFIESGVWIRPFFMS